MDVSPVRSAGQDQQWLAIGAEHQAVRDRAQIAAKLRGGGRGGRRGFGQLPDLACGTEGL